MRQAAEGRGERGELARGKMGLGKRSNEAGKSGKLQKKKKHQKIEIYVENLIWKDNTKEGSHGRDEKGEGKMTELIYSESQDGADFFFPRIKNIERAMDKF